MPQIPLLLLLLLLLARAIEGAPLHSSAGDATLFFKDASGRSLLFHGVNAVYKKHPWLPSAGTFSATDSLNSQDIANLRLWGFNVVRLGVMWPGVLPDGVNVNHSYIGQVQRLIGELQANDISVIIDMHQDVLSRKYCGEGIPDALVQPTDNPLLQFPMPVTFPYAVDAHQYPNLQTCLQKVAKLFGRLYDSNSDLNRAYLKFWDVVSGALKGTPGVLGYELLNEPSPGDFFERPALVIPGVADKEMLVPLYRQLEAVIRRNDAHTHIFFEPVVSDVWTSGFNKSNLPNAQGGPLCYSYHVYCGSVNRTDDTPSNMALCELEQAGSWALRMEDLQRLGVVGFMTEFGAWSGHPRSVEILNWQLDLADAYLQSTTYWQFKYYQDLTTVAGPDEGLYDASGRLQSAKVRTLSRTYAQATQGVPVQMSFTAQSALFQFSYVSDTTVQAPTLIYLNEEFYYQQGFDVAITPSGAAHWERVGDANRLSFWADAHNVTIAITIAPKS